MAREWYYNPGDNWLLDDLSGFKIRASRSKRIPGGQTGGAQVAPERWEAQQPQDFVRGVPDVQTPDIVRSRQQNRFTVLATYVTAPSARLTGIIQVASPVGFAAGQNVLLMLDSGENFPTSIGGVVGNEITLGTPLPFSVGTLYGDPIENTLLFVNNGPPLFTGFYNDGGVLAIVYPSLLPPGPGALPAGAVYDAGGTVGIVPGIGPGSLVLTFNTVSQGMLVSLGGGLLPTSAPAGSLQLYNNGDEVAVA